MKVSDGESGGKKITLREKHYLIVRQNVSAEWHKVTDIRKHTLRLGISIAVATVTDVSKLVNNRMQGQRGVSVTLYIIPTFNTY